MKVGWRHRRTNPVRSCEEQAAGLVLLYFEAIYIGGNGWPSIASAAGVRVGTRRPQERLRLLLVLACSMDV